MDNLNFAVYVDAENIPSNLYHLALSKVAERGCINIKNVYADWSIPCNKSWKEVLKETLSSAKQQFHYGENDVDSAIVMDSIELVITNNNINAIAIMSSDGGFFSLAQRLRESGIYVIVLGDKNTPLKLQTACHEFIALDHNVLQEESLRNKALEASLLMAYQARDVQQRCMFLSTFGSLIKKNNPNFSVNKYGFKSLKKLLDAHPLFYLQKCDKHKWVVHLRPTTPVIKFTSLLVSH